MKFGLVPINVGIAAPEQMITTAQAAEEAGFESVWTFEHVIVPVDYQSKYPYSNTGKMGAAPETPFVDPLIALTAIAAQTQPDAERLIALGADPAHTHVTGSIKFDIKLPVGLREQAAALRREFGNDRPVWIAASTHEGEEDCVLDAFEQVKRVMPNCLLVLVPRHPERFAPVAGLCRRRGHCIALRSELQPCDAETDVFVGDTMGELPLFYAASDLAFVGGSLVPSGCHNLMEPAALGIPMITGPHLFNYEEASRMLMDVGAMQAVRDAAQLAAAVEMLLRDATLRDTAGGNGRKVVEENRGALKRLLEIVEKYVG